MKRRTFIKSCAAGAVALGVSKPVAVLASEVADESALGLGFQFPPASARPKTWWNWMNGNVTREGITLDLKFMQRVGVGGVQLRFLGEGLPEGPVVFGSPEYFELVEFAAKEAERLGLDFDLFNGPGWSSSGGPWITPELSMQRLTWSETLAAGGKLVDIPLPQPFTKLGYYRDAFVLAFPSLEGESRPLRQLIRKATSSSGPVDANLLTDSGLLNGVEVHQEDSGQPAFLQWEFAEPFEARSVEIHTFPAAEALSPGNSRPPITLEVSDDGGHYREITELYTLKIWGPPAKDIVEVPLTANFPATRAKYFRLVSSSAFKITDLRLSGSVRIIEWPYKANFVSRGDRPFGHEHEFGLMSTPFPPTGATPEGSVIDLASVLDITQYMDARGRLRWQAPVGEWTILRFGHTTTGMKNHPATEGGTGLECDKFNGEAYEFHFNHFLGKLFPVLDPLAAKGKVTLVIDSWENGMQNWTARFPQEFESRRGYSLLNYMPAMTGRVVGNGDMSDRFLWDIRRTCADLMTENYYGQFAKICHEHGMKTSAQTYTPGPFEEIQSGSRMDVPQGEFWVDMRNRFHPHSVKLASSIGHVFGKPIISAESFTTAPPFAKWEEYPYSMKAKGDWACTQGLNQFCFNSYVMQPHPTAAPGITDGAWGWMHSRNNTWAEQEHSWLEYLTRCQYLLQRGRLVADLVYFTGVEVPASTAIWPDQLDPTPPEGYYYDVANAEAILNRMNVEDGRIVLPDGMSYRMLVLASDNRLTLALLHKLRYLVEQGVCLVGAKPQYTPGLTGFPESQKELTRIAGEVWGDLNATTKTERALGRGRVFWGRPLSVVLDKLNIHPDCQITSRSGDAAINFIHRRVGDSDVYFLANRRRRSEDLVCTFRVKGRCPEFWSADSGAIMPATIYEPVEGGVRLPVRLGPAGSTFVVFRSSAPVRSFVRVAKDNVTAISAKPFPAPDAGLYRGVVNNFTISVWVMPDMDTILPGGSADFDATSFVIYPPAGAALYGQGHVACGLTAGRDGVILWERGNDDPLAALVAAIPLAGWTHLAIVYRESAPSLYVNGKLVAQGENMARTAWHWTEQSMLNLVPVENEKRKIVHPGIGEAYQRDDAQYFHGNMSEPEVFPEVLGGNQIEQLASTGAPEPEEPPAIELGGGKKAELLIWQDGRYTLNSSAGHGSSFEISGIGKPVEIKGPWHLGFPPDLGAPRELILPELISLHRHPEAGVRYFSGTTTYTNRFYVKSDATTRDRRLYLDLGWVQVIAEVLLNDRNLGTLWKVPFQLDITDAVRFGNNNLEIRVTNLWPNRLIGDEYLPPENDYAKGDWTHGGGAIVRFPDWYIRGAPKPPGGRITFTTWKHFDKDSPLVESGLIGPVRLRTAIRALLI